MVNILKFFHMFQKKTFSIVLLFFLSFNLTITAQKKIPKREMRAVWIATVFGIDWPSKPGLSTAQQQQEFINLLDLHKKNGMNAVVMQVRPCSDAFYKSDLEPWSQWLTGQQGRAPSPFYDPLKFMIDETHKRCMEFHAWFNPYRVLMDTSHIYRAAENHISKTHPEWLVDYGKKRYFDPALPETRAFVTNIITDVLRRYDVDAIHFDDYFYPYKIKGVEFPDSASFAKYPRGYTADKKADWRRNNVDLIIKMLNDSIKAIKPYVKFGISPFGIWRNKSQDPRGSDTNGGDNYDGLYADILKWLENGWIDYVVPQIYWHIGKEVADYAILVDWWNKNSYNKHLYIGQGIYRMSADSRDKSWRGRKEIPDQLALNRKYKNVDGSVYFSSKSFQKNRKNINKKIRKKFYKYPALVPQMNYIDSIPPESPINFSYIEDKDKYYLFWDIKKSETEMNKARFFVIYKFSGKTDFNNPENIYAIVKEPRIAIKKRFFGSKAQIYITAVDRLFNESKPTKPIAIKI